MTEIRDFDDFGQIQDLAKTAKTRKLARPTSKNRPGSGSWEKYEIQTRHELISL